MGWSGTKNGKLLALAGAAFDIERTSSSQLRWLPAAAHVER
jgi:hypothetical protein